MAFSGAERQRRYRERHPERAKECNRKRKAFLRKNDASYRQRQKEYMEEYRKKNKDRLLSLSKERNRIWRIQNAERKKSYDDKYRLENAHKIKAYVEKNKEKMSEYQKQYRESHLDKHRLYMTLYLRKKYHHDIQYRLTKRLRGRIRDELREQTTPKALSTQELLGCDIATARAHLERQFVAGMSWENYGSWHIDHIIPCSSFDLRRVDEQLKCFHYSNLQPLWAVENIKKGAKLITCEVQNVRTCS